LNLVLKFWLLVMIGLLMTQIDILPLVEKKDSTLLAFISSTLSSNRPCLLCVRVVLRVIVIHVIVDPVSQGKLDKILFTEA